MLLLSDRQGGYDRAQPRFSLIVHIRPRQQSVGVRRRPWRSFAAVLPAQFYSSADIIMNDLDGNRLEVEKRFGATAFTNNADGKAVEAVTKMTGMRGVDTATEAMGLAIRVYRVAWSIV